MRLRTVTAIRALLIANAADADAGFAGDRFRHHGYAFTECHRERRGEWPQLEAHDLVLLACGLNPSPVERSTIDACTAVDRLERWILRAATAGSISELLDA